jgi:hypothetical protein
MADSKDIRDWIQTLSVLAVVAGAIVGVYQYRLGVAAEQRQRASNQAEIDIRLSAAFADLMRTANGRGASQLSDKCMEKLTNPDASRSCVVEFPVGAAQQKAAIAAVGMLGKQYYVLRQPAIEGLKQLTEEFTRNPDFAAVAQRALSQVEAGPTQNTAR